MTAHRDSLRGDIHSSIRGVVEIARRLVAIPSMTPPGDTNALVAALVDYLGQEPGIELREVRTADHVANLVAIVRGAAPGRRLVFNGHLDTFPIGDATTWSVSPWGEERDGRLYGLGISDMKGGVAAAVFALQILARHRSSFSGELVGTFVGDEETASGLLGTQYLLDTVPEARGDAMISGDIGSPRVLRFGEKGLIWMTIKASGRASHAAHVHKGDSAIERIVRVMHDLQQLKLLRPNTPADVLAAIDNASAISELQSGAGETEVLKGVTVTFGTIRGGRLPNLVADEAEMTVDIRLPVGLQVADVRTAIETLLCKHEHVTSNITTWFEPTWTFPDHELLRTVSANCKDVLSVDPVVNMRIGASDARLYRRAGVPSVVCGLTPYNLGTADEYVKISELHALAEIFSLSAFDYLSTGN
jgi:succinyl-diaminopimelate desuccinylase